MLRMPRNYLPRPHSLPLEDGASNHRLSQPFEPHVQSGAGMGHREHSRTRVDDPHVILKLDNLSARVSCEVCLIQDYDVRILKHDRKFFVTSPLSVRLQSTTRRFSPRSRELHRVRFPRFSIKKEIDGHQWKLS